MSHIYLHGQLEKRKGLWRRLIHRTAAHVICSQTCKVSRRPRDCTSWILRAKLCNAML